MAIPTSVSAGIQRLIDESPALTIGNSHDQCNDPTQMAKCSAWITAAQNMVHLVIPQPSAPYRAKIDSIANARQGFVVHRAVQELAAILSGLLRDSQAGLLSSIADEARAETFDDFLDHATAYLSDSRKNEAGVIAGVVFEDSLRRVCRKLGIQEKGQKLDSLISALATAGQLSPVKAKRARACADVRTKATHAQWSEFETDDVRATIEFTRELIASKLT